MILEAWSAQLLGWLFVLARVAGIFSVAPIFGNARVPPQVRVILSAALALAIAPIAAVPGGLTEASLPVVVLGLVREAVVGLAIGFVATLVLSAAQIGGELIDHEIGFGLSSTIDPLTNVQMPVMAKFLQLFATLIFLVSGAHHWLIRALADSYTLIRPGSALALEALSQPMMDIFVAVFLTGLKIAGPILGVLLLCDVCLGLVARTTPQLNLLMVGFPLKIGVGILAFLVALPAIAVVLAQLMGSIYGDVMTIARAAGGG